MKHRIQLITSALGALAIATFFLASPVEARNAEDRECVRGCAASFKECRGLGNEDFRTCRTDAGCSELRGVAKAICGDDADEAACEEARGAVRDCVAPCREALKAEAGACREDGLACLVDDCGLELDNPGRALKRGRPGRKGHRPHGPREEEAGDTID